MVRMLKKNGFLLMGLLLSVNSSAQILPQWEIIPAESALTFTATQNGAPVSGNFKQFTGQIYVDEAHFKNSMIDIVIDMNSLSTSYAQVQELLIGPDWFDVKTYPKAEFKAMKYKKTGPKSYEAEGMLTIKNKTGPVTLSFTAEETPKNHALVIGHTMLKRSAFGVGLGEWASTSEIKDEVTVEFKINAHKK